MKMVLVGAALLGVVGCGPRGLILGGNDLPAQFPTQSEVQHLKTAEAPARLADPTEREVENVGLEGFAGSGARRHSRADIPLGNLLADAAKGREGLLSTPESMNCLARLRGQFYLSNGGVPSIEVSEFLASRCAVVDTETSTYYSAGTVTGTMSDDQLFEKTRGSIQEAIQKVLANGNQTAGIWFGRAENRVVAMMVYSPHRIVLDHVPFVPGADGHVVLRGEVLVPAEHVDGLINYGRFGVKRCSVDPKVRLPHFSLDCETNLKDVSAALEIGVFPPARLTGKITSHLVVWPAGRVSTQYVKPTYGPAMQAPGTRFTEVARVAAQLGTKGSWPIAGDAERRGEHYCSVRRASLLCCDDWRGLRDGPRSSGDGAQGRLAGPGAHRLLPFHLEPNARYQQCGAPAGGGTRLPVGRRGASRSGNPRRRSRTRHLEEGGNPGRGFHQLRLHRARSEPEEVISVINLLAERRKEKGLRPPVLNEDVQSSVLGASRRIELGQSDPKGAMQEAMNDNRSTTSGVQAWFIFTENLQRITFPDKLLTDPTVHIGIGVSHYKPPNFPWALRGILIVMKIPASITAPNPFNSAL